MDAFNSVAGAIWRNTLPGKLQQYLPNEVKGQAKSIFGSIVVARKYAVGTEARDAINRSYRESQRLLAIAALVSLSLTLIVRMWSWVKMVGQKQKRKTMTTGPQRRKMRKVAPEVYMFVVKVMAFDGSVDNRAQRHKWDDPPEIWDSGLLLLAQGWMGSRMEKS
jgi:hypothetical protein